MAYSFPQNKVAYHAPNMLQYRTASARCDDATNHSLLNYDGWIYFY
jgi:hypothetical protein